MSCCTNNSAVSASDSFPVYDQGNSSRRCVSADALAAYVAQKLALDNGLLGLSSIAGLRGGAQTVALTTSFSPITNYAQPGFNLNDHGDAAFYLDTANGLIYASRDLQAASVNLMVNGSWAAGVDLTLAVFVSNGTTPTQSDLIMSSVGTGATRAVAASGIVMNFSIPLGVIKAGQYLYLGAKLSTAGNLVIASAALNAQSIDGV